MFQLEKFDPAPEGVQLRDRLRGLITKQFKVTSFLGSTVSIPHF